MVDLESYEEADEKIALLIAYSSKGQPNAIPYVLESLKTMTDFIKGQAFNQIIVLSEENATPGKVDLSLKKVAHRCAKHRER